MKDLPPSIGKIVYAILFIVILPALLWLWASYAEASVSYPAIESSHWGISLTLVGGILMLWGMIALMTYGKGLPMNPYPPKRYVKKGPYRLLHHPIYWGFTIAVAGISIWKGSASGLWLITPIAMLGIMALIWGYERIDLRQRFPGENLNSYLDVYQNGTTPASIRDRFAALFWVYLVLILSNFVVSYLVGATPALFGSSWSIHPIFNNRYLHYVSFLFFASVPLVAKSQDDIKMWVISVLIALPISMYISLLWPAVGAQYFPSGFASWGAEERFLILLTNTPLFLILLSLRSYVHHFRRFAIFFYALAIITAVFQLVNSQASLLHLVIGLIVFFIAAYYIRIWIFLKDKSEQMANSWREWTFGPIRVINHGFYVGLGAFVGILIAGLLAGKEYAWVIVLCAAIGIIISALWAQLIEGSEKLKRPFGYYGGLVAIPIGSVVIWAMGYHVWVVLAVISVVMPWAQAFGRLRCLINGCCHGHPVKDPNIGIRYFHERSRVCGLSGLKGELLHPTPLYAILWLFLMGFVLLALWNNHASYSLIFGLYLILTGVGRFVEEAYRGEVQTPTWNGLHLYQWTAIISVVIGIIMTTIPAPAIVITPEFDWKTIAAAFTGGFFVFFAMGVDFPRSNARFSRLV